MTKTVALADDAYEALAAFKQPGESFSQLARRAARELARQYLFDRNRKPIFTKEEAEELKRRIYASRDEPGRTYDRP